jgi:hypothetical protein
MGTAVLRLVEEPGLEVELALEVAVAGVEMGTTNRSISKNFTNKFCCNSKHIRSM